jgi:hypothetical protein
MSELAAAEDEQPVGIGHTARWHFGHPNTQTEARRLCEHHPIRSSTAPIYLTA